MGWEQEPCFFKLNVLKVGEGKKIRALFWHIQYNKFARSVKEKLKFIFDGFVKSPSHNHRGGRGHPAKGGTKIIAGPFLGAPD